MVHVNEERVSGLKKKIKHQEAGLLVFIVVSKELRSH